MQELIRHKQILSYLKNCALNNTLAHAYAFIGSNRIGRMNLLDVFLREFVPSKALEHPDIKIIEPEKGIITIDIIRQARSWLSMTPISADKKVLIIKSADLMNTQAQNAFLKILEEPAESTYIFLLINHKLQVLETIYSRTVPLYFSGSAEVQEDIDTGLIDEIFKTSDSAQRMRAWMQANLPKDAVHDWLISIVPALRIKLLKTKSKKSAQAIRSVLESLAQPIGQNWTLVAEKLIISF